MSYNIVHTDGTLITLVPDNTVNTTALPINLFGRGLVDYGMGLNENCVSLLENFSNITPPDSPLHGQLWYNSAQDTLYLRSAAPSLVDTSGSWVPIQLQNNAIGKEITVEDQQGNAAELDGTGYIYLQNVNNPGIAFLNNLAVPLSSGDVVASIILNGSTLTIQPGLNVMGNQTITGKLNVSNLATVLRLNAINGISSNNLTLSGNATIGGDGNIAGNLNVNGDGGDNGGISLNVPNGYFVCNSTIIARAADASGYVYVQPNGGLNLQNNSNNAQITFRDYTGIDQGSITLTNVGTTGWNSGATNPYALVLLNALEVDGNQLITGNLTVRGNITGGSFLPLAGGTLTGDLNMSNCNLNLTNATSPGISLYATSQGSTVGTSGMHLVVDGIDADIQHVIFSSNHILSIANQIGVNLTTPGVSIFSNTIIDGKVQAWPTALVPNGVFTRSTPTFVLCDPGAGANNNQVGGDSWSMGFNMPGNTQSPNNYQLNIASFDSTGHVISVLMTIFPTGNATLTGTLSQTSDRRVKTDIKTIQNAVETIGKMRGVSYKRLDDGSDNIGLIAQEVREVVPELVQEDNDGMLSISYGNVVGLLVNGINELSEKNKSLEDRIEALEIMMKKLM